MTTKFTTYSTNGRAHNADLFTIVDADSPTTMDEVHPTTVPQRRGWRLLRRALIALVSLLLMVVLYVLVMALTDGLKIGTAAPEFVGTTLQGQTLRLADLHGKPTMLVFWSPYCSACRHELPAIKAIAEDPNRQVELVTIVSYVPEAEVDDFAKANDLQFPIINDESGQISKQYNVHGIPFTYLINGEGRIDNTVVGSGEQNTLSSKLGAWISTCDVQEVCK